TGAGQVRLLAGSRGDWAALAVLDEHRLLVQPAHGGRPGLTGEQLENRLIRGGVTLADARSFAVMMRGPKPGGGRFGATRRDRDGIRHSGGIALVYLATERGGYTVAPRRGPDGSAWTTLAPATLAQLARRIGRLLSDISHQPSDQR
ncbi:MAG: ESX secretion-associated protein EspG, partial [Mycobacteriales bacterium]